MSQPLPSAVRAGTTTPPPDGERLSALINMAGRQRMLSQRLVLHAVLAARQRAQPSAPSQALSALPVFRDTLERMARAHERLAHGGGEWPGAFSDGLRQAYFAPRNADARIRDFLGLAHEAEAAQRTRQERNHRQELMDRLHAVAREAKVVAFNAQVAAHRAGAHGPEFGVVAARMGVITEEMEKLLRQARGH